MARLFQPVIACTILGLIIASSGCLPSGSGSTTTAATKQATTEAPDVAETATQEKQPAAPAPPADPLRIRIEAALTSVHNRDLLTTNSFWTVFHGILGMGPQSTTLKDPETGKRYNALDFVFSEDGARIRGLVFTPTAHGVDVQTVGLGAMPGVKEHEAQGHQDQFLAEMIQWGVPADRPVRIAGFPERTFKLQDFVEESKARCRIDERQELSWCLIVVADYGGGTEAVWTNKYGQKLRYEQLLEYEMNADINVAACGGTHRLFGVAWAYHRHMKYCSEQKKKPSAVWEKAKHYLDKYKDLSQKWQAPDGGFSTAHYRENEHVPELEPRLAASGHMLEWLVQYVSDEELRAPWMEKAALSVAQTILDGERVPVASGSIYHAAHGLATYHARRYKTKTEPKIAGK